MQGEPRVQSGLQGCQHDRHVFGTAPGHDGVDGDLLDRAGRQLGGDLADDLVRVAARAAQHAQDALGRRRDHREAIAPAAVIARLDGIGAGSDLDRAGADSGSAEAHPQGLHDPRLHRAGATAGPVERQSRAQRGDGRERAPVFTTPADRAAGFRTAQQPDQRRYRLDAEVEGALQGAVVHGGGGEAGAQESAVVLPTDGQRMAGLVDLGENGDRQVAGLALVLHDSDVGGGLGHDAREDAWPPRG